MSVAILAQNILNKPKVSENMSAAHADSDSDFAGDSMSASTLTWQEAKHKSGGSLGKHKPAQPCYACEQGILPGQEIQNFRGEVVHAECYPGIRSYLRVLQINPVAQEKEKEEFTDQPDKWRRDVAPFLLVDGISRKAAINAVRQRVKKEEEYEDHQLILDEQELTKSDWVEHLASKGIDAKDAEADFDAKWSVHKEKDKATNSVPVLLLEQPAKRRRIIGSRSSSVLMDPPPTGTGDSVSVAGTGLKGVAGTSSELGSAQVLPSNNVAMSVTTGIPNGAKDTKRARNASLKKAPWKTSAENGQAEVNKAFSKLSGSKGKVSTVAFMTCRESLKESYRNLLNSYNMKQSIPVKLRSVIRTLASETSFQADTTKPFARLEEIKNEMLTNMSAVEKMQNNVETLALAKKTYEQVMDGANECMDELSDLYEGAQLAKKKEASSSRVAKQAVRYQKNKVPMG